MRDTVSIPQGTIKRDSIYQHDSIYIVSIPQGTIKSTIPGNERKEERPVSIPQGTIKRRQETNVKSSIRSFNSTRYD